MQRSKPHPTPRGSTRTETQRLSRRIAKADRRIKAGGSEHSLRDRLAALLAEVTQ